jgi:hypothetical protein
MCTLDDVGFVPAEHPSDVAEPNQTIAGPADKIYVNAERFYFLLMRLVPCQTEDGHVDAGVL